MEEPPSPKSHDQTAGEPEERSVKLAVKGTAQLFVMAAVKDNTGAEITVIKADFVFVPVHPLASVAIKVILYMPGAA